MLRQMVFTALAVSAISALSATSGLAGNKGACPTKDPCTVFRAGHVRGRLSIACVSIPFAKRGYGQIAMFVMRDFNPNVSPSEIQEQLKRALFKDSKVTGPLDDFCRNPNKFAEGNWVVFTSERTLLGDELGISESWGRGIPVAPLVVFARRVELKRGVLTRGNKLI